MSALDAAVKVLAEARQAMTCREMIDAMLERVEYDGRDGDLDIWLRSDQKEAS